MDDEKMLPAIGKNSHQTREIEAVFITGCDRSGTTLIADMLGVLPGTLVTPESHFLDSLLNCRKDWKRKSQTIALQLVTNYWFSGWFEGKNISKEWLIGELQKDPAELVEALLTTFSAAIERSDFKVWIDHTPRNHARWGTLLNIFPKAKFIHIVRDGRAVFNSLKSVDWGPATPHYAAKFWVEAVSSAVQLEQCPAIKCLTVRYEDLVESPENELKKVCAFLNQPFRGDMICGGGFRKPSYTIGYHKLVGSRPDSSRINEWRRRLTTREISCFQSSYCASDYLTRYGYQVDDLPAVGSGYLALNLCIEALNEVRNKIRDRRINKK